MGNRRQPCERRGLADPHPASNDTEGCTYRFTQEESKESTLADAPKEFKSIISAVTGGKTARVAGLLGGAILGFIIAGRPDPGPRNLTLKAGQEIRLELAEDLLFRR